MIIHKLHDEKIMNRMAADMFCAQIIAKPTSIIGFATGSTPIGLYNELIQRYNEKSIDFSTITSFNLDEYCGLSRKHEQSYYSFMMDNLFSKVNIKSENIHLPKGMATDIDAECEEYEQEINRSGGIDFQILGIGLNGHIGFNEPNNMFSNKTHKEHLTDSTREANKRFFNNNIDQVPIEAITMGIGTIMRARQIILLGAKGKQTIIERMISDSINPQCPASILHVHSQVTVLYLEN